LACHRAGGDLPSDHPFQVEGKRVKYDAHTATGDNGTPLPEYFWQPLAALLPNVLGLAEFRSPGLKIRLQEVTYGR